MPMSEVLIEYANITLNRGHGVYMNSTRGSLVIKDSSVTSNMADGVKIHIHDQRPESRVIEGLDIHDFCTYSTTYSQTYPLLMVAEQYKDSMVERYSTNSTYICICICRTKRWNVLFFCQRQI